MRAILKSNQNFNQEPIVLPAVAANTLTDEYLRLGRLVLLWSEIIAANMGHMMKNFTTVTTT